MLAFVLYIFFSIFWGVKAQRSIRNGAPLFVTAIYGFLTLINAVMILVLLRK